MAKKKEERLSYLQMPLPQEGKETTTVKVNWSGLNYRQTKDSGALSYEKNISTDEAPYLTPARIIKKVFTDDEKKSEDITDESGNVVETVETLNRELLKIYSWGAKIVTVYKSEKFNIDIYDPVTWEKESSEIAVSDNDYSADNKCAITTFDVSASVEDVSEECKNTLLFFPGAHSVNAPINIVVPYIRTRNGYKNGSPIYDETSFFNQFQNKKHRYTVVETNIKVPDDVRVFYYYNSKTRREYEKKDILSTWFRGTDTAVGSNNLRHGWVPNAKVSIEEAKTFSDGCPKLTAVTTFQSRVFGIDGDKVYASGFGDYANWNMDTAEEVSSQNAWYSFLSANPEADGRLTAITTYQDRVVVFRENYMYEIRNTKNPFRVVDIFNEGCIGPDACAVVNGYLLFANKNGVRMYTGAKPRDIGYQLGMNEIYYATSGTDGRKWYLYCETDKKEHNLFVYDTTTGLWSELEVEKRLISFTKNEIGLYALSDDNCIYRLDSGDYTGQEWAAETDLTVGNTVNIKHIKKLQLLAELSAGSELRVYTLYDDEVFDPKTSVCVYQKKNENEDSITIPIRVLIRKSAHYGCRIRIEGTGYAKVYQMEITLTGGGELYRGEES